MTHGQFMVNLRTGCCYAVLCESGSLKRAVLLSKAEDVRDSALAYDFDAEGRDATGWRKGEVRNIRKEWIRRHLGRHGDAGMGSGADGVSVDG